MEKQTGGSRRWGSACNVKLGIGDSNKVTNLSLSQWKKEARKAYAAQLAAPAVNRKAILHRPTGEAAKLLGYESSVPRCETCRQYQKGKTLLHKATANLPVIQLPPVCLRGRFHTSATALCDHWVGKDGSTLERGGDSDA